MYVDKLMINFLIAVRFLSLFFYINASLFPFPLPRLFTPKACSVPYTLFLHLLARDIWGFNSVLKINSSILVCFLTNSSSTALNLTLCLLYPVKKPYCFGYLQHLLVPSPHTQFLFLEGLECTPGTHRDECGIIAFFLLSKFRLLSSD